MPAAPRSHFSSMAEERSEHAREAAIVAENCMLVSALAVGPEMANTARSSGWVGLLSAMMTSSTLGAVYVRSIRNSRLVRTTAHWSGFSQMGEKRTLVLDPINAWCGKELITGFSND